MLNTVDVLQLYSNNAKTSISKRYPACKPCSSTELLRSTVKDDKHDETTLLCIYLKLIPLKT